MNPPTPASPRYQQRITFSIARPEDDQAASTPPQPKRPPLFDTLQENATGSFGLPVDQASANHQELLLSSTPFQSPNQNFHGNAFFHTAFKAYCQHQALVLNPDTIWLAICQGFALHLNQHPNTWRARLVSHEGQKPLITYLVPALLNDASAWINALSQMRKQIALHTKENITDTIAARFSGTDIHSQAAFDITLMLSFKSYFGYAFFPICGIPEITLEGTTADWSAVQQRFEHLVSFGLERWATKLRPVLQEFTNASHGDINPDFWTNIISYHEGCGQTISGWFAYFFPYVLSDRGDQLWVNPKFQNEDYALDLDQIPSGCTDLDVFNLSDGSILCLKAGFAGMHKDEQLNGALRATIGWGVYETDRMMSEADKNQYAEHLNTLNQSN